MPMRTVRRRRLVAPPPPRPATVRPSWPGWLQPSRVWLALLPLGGVALGGATERWSQGWILLALGGVLAALPPRAKLGRWLALVLAGLLGLSLTAFLPARWFPTPVWRAALTDDLGVVLPGTLSPHPFLTAESLVVFAAGLAWLGVMATVRWADEERRRAGALFAGGVVALAVVAVGCYRAGVLVPIWPSERHFGLFPNRNQTADFFALGALPVLACGRAAWRAGRKPVALAWLAGWLLVALATFHSFSRAGVILLVLTTAAYLGEEAFHRTRHHRIAGKVARWRRLAMVLSFALLVGSGALLFGGDTLGRLRSGDPAAGGNEMSNTLRRSIYTDTLGMIARSPWCGNGVNTFNEIFPAYRHTAVQNPLRVRHPESDWLWLGAELGWGGVALALAGVGMLLRRLRPPRHGHDRPLRLAAAVGVLGFLAHGLVDVSGHRVGTAFAALFLLGLALPGNPAKTDAADVAPVSPVLPWRGWLRRGAGIVFLLVGALWTVGALLPGEQGVARLKSQALVQASVGDLDPAHQTLTRALAWAPLDWRLRYMRGAVGVDARRDVNETLLDFRRARYLENVDASLPRDEARLWAAAGQTGPAVSALLEACRRNPVHAAALIRPVYALAHGDPAFLDRIGPVARRDPALAVALLEALAMPDSADFVDDVLRADPDLGRFSDGQKTTFFRLWAWQAEPGSLVTAMAAHPAWQALGWRWWADATARDGTPAGAQAASGIAARFAATPKLPPAASETRSLAELKREVREEIVEPLAVLELYRAQLAANAPADALKTLQGITTRPGCPAYFYYLEAQDASTQERWLESWAAWEHYLQATRANEVR